jgi:hypothetical protein
MDSKWKLALDPCSGGVPFTSNLPISAHVGAHIAGYGLADAEVLCRHLVDIEIFY